RRRRWSIARGVRAGDSGCGAASATLASSPHTRPVVPSASPVIPSRRLRMSILGRLISRRRPYWEESWRSYPGLLDDAPAQWTVDIGAVDAAPVAELPVRLDVRYPFP